MYLYNVLSLRRVLKTFYVLNSFRDFDGILNKIRIGLLSCLYFVHPNTFTRKESFYFQEPNANFTYICSA